jgi:hypothetical protein
MTERFTAILEQTQKLSSTASLKERVAAYAGRVAESKAYLCHFCKKREAEANCCASLSCKQETSRQHYGNVIRVQYRLGARLVARCPQCADLHEYLRNAGRLAFYAAAAALVLFFILRPFHVMSHAGIGMWVFALGFGGFAAWLVGVVVRRFISWRVLGPGEVSFAQYQDSMGYQQMLQDGFHGGMKYDYRRNAWELVNTEGVAARHGGGGGTEALTTLFWIALFIAAVSLRVCL